MKPGLRGWVALVVAIGSSLLFPLLRPALVVRSAEGIFLSEPVRPGVWITGAALIIVCFGTSAEALRRGQGWDRVFAGIALLLSVSLLWKYLQLFGLPVA